LEIRRVVEEIEHDDSQAGTDDVQVVRPSPPGCGVGRKLLSNDWSEAGDLEGRRKDRSYPNRTVFVRATVLKKEETYNYSSDKSWRSVVLFWQVRSKSIFVNSIGIRLNGDMIRLV
jgi:hypothetical protein